MSLPEDRGAPTRPDIVALTIHRDRERDVSILYPEGWHRYDFDAGNGAGVLFSPSSSADDLGTHISLELRELPTPIRARDLPELEKAFLAGLSQLAGSAIESHTSYDAGWALGIEAYQTFLENGQRRKRWIRLLYDKKRQARLVAQGATEEDFESWLVRFKPALTTFNFGDVWPAP